MEKHDIAKPVITENTVDNFLKLLGMGMQKGYDQNKINEIIKQEGLNNLFCIADSNNVMPFLYKTVAAYNGTEDDKKLLTLWKNHTQKTMFTEMSKSMQIFKLSKKAKEENLTFVFFKGIALASLYPQSFERPGCDSDIFVYEEEKEDAIKLLNNMDYRLIEDECKENVLVFLHENPKHVIELHTRLWEDFTGPKIEKLKEMDLTNKDSLVNICACNIHITTLGYEEHLIYQMFHVIKHFSLDGIGMRYLLDITYYINAYYAKIDWENFWKKIEYLGYSCFCDSFFKICIDYLGMNPKILANRNVRVTKEIEQFKLDLLYGGHTIKKDADWQIMGAMAPYFTGNAKVASSEVSRKIQMIFPSVKSIPSCYTYVKKHPCLLPFAWIQRDFKFLWKYIFHHDQVYSVKEKINVGENRLSLIKNLGLNAND